MDRIVKVLCTGADQDRVADRCRVIERYDGFVLVEIPKIRIGGLSRQYPIEDVTEQYTIRAGDQVLDTSRPRLDAQGKVHAHPGYRRAKPLSRGPHHYLVQFIGPIKAEWLTAVKRAGGEPREPYQDFTYVVRADGATLRRIAGLPFVRWVGHLSHMDRVAPSVLERAGRRPSDPSSALPRTRVIPAAYTVEFFGSRDLTAAAPTVKKLGLKVMGKDATARVLVVETAGGERERRRQIEALAAVHGVRSIRERALKRTSNDVASGIMNASQAMGNPGLGLNGKGEVVGICDTGLDTGDPATIHPDFAGRIAWIKSYPITPDLSPYVHNPGGDDGPADLDSGHGTHVAGSALGSGSASVGLSGLSGPIRGLAYNALLAFQAVEQEMQWKNPAHLKFYGRYILAGIPLDLATLLSYAYWRRVRIHSNSWGGGDPGAYDAQCEQLDRFVWAHKTFTVLAAAGNDGTDGDGDGKINPMSVTSPATAKNCITVGACENRRPNFNSQTYGGWWPKDYPVAPFRNDPMANDPDQVAAFSSRGPTEDGRIKPDVIGPGTFILSPRSTQIAQNHMAWAGFPPSKLYFHMGGTSMATPLVAGAAALVREYLRRRKKIAQPTAALLKAALIAGASRLSGYASAGAVFDHHQGFGRVDLDAVLSPPKPASTTFRQVRPGLRTGEIRTFSVKVKSGAVPLRVILAYSDYPGPSLVNNLNLLVTAPEGTQYVGNQSATGGMHFDAKNNVEVVHIQKPDGGTWKIAVVASNVPQGPQDFALVYIAHVQT